MWVKWERWKEGLDRGKATEEQIKRVKVNKKKRIRTRKKEKKGRVEGRWGIIKKGKTRRENNIGKE